jgi:hypothetical protein
VTLNVLSESIKPSGKILIDAGPSGSGWSSIESFNHCERLYWFRHVEKRPDDVEEPTVQFSRNTADYETLEPSPLIFTDGPLVRGSLGHVGLAHYYARRKAIEDGTDPDQFYTPEEAMNVWADKNTVHPELRAILPMVVDKYRRWCDVGGGDSIMAKLTGVEQRFSATLTDYKGRKWVRTQRFDLIFEDHAGMIWVNDHKFVYAPTKQTYDRYNMSGQFMLARLFGQQLFGDRFGGVLINLVGVDPDTLKVFRKPIEPAPAALRTFVDTTGNTLARIEDLRAQNDFLAWRPAYHEQICTTTYKSNGSFRCPFWDRCAWG